MSTAMTPAFTAPPVHLDRQQLPQPFIDGKDAWLQTHDLAWELAFKHIAYHPRLAQKHYMDEACMPDRLWQWDTCFMALYTAYARPVFPGVESLDNFYAWQRADGLISMCHLIDSGAPAYGERVNPPLLAWVEWEYYRMTGDDTRFARVLPHLVKYYDWIRANRRRPRIEEPHQELNPSTYEDDGGLYWETCAGAMGTDNSPRCTHLSWEGGELCFIDLSSQQALAALHIAKIAAHLGQPDIVRRFEREYALLRQLVNRWMWCERSQFYHDIYLDGNFHSARTICSFWPMLALLASPAQADALLGHLRNPMAFWRPHPVPTLSFDNPNYVDSGGYWLGGVWAPSNYMVVRGLLEYGHDATAHEIACRHLEAITQVAQSHEPHTLWEAYAPEAMTPCTGKDKKTWVRPDFCGWSALGATSMLYENIIGVRGDAPARSLTWDIRLPQAHGFERYPFLGQWLALRAEAEGDGARQLTINTPVEITLIARRQRQQRTLRLAAGEHQAQI